MEQLNIRAIGIDDVVALQKIARETFSEMFADYNSADNLKKYLDEKFTLTKLSEELHHPHSTFYFAQIGEEVVGYLKTNTGEAQTELMDLNAFEIQRIYVLQAYHGKKVGQQLIEKAIEEARKTTCAYVWLGVWEENHRAIRFYSKNGFIKFDTHIFKMGDEEQMDWLMKLEL
ncbi:MAG: Protease synthase and sporulation negative regulatory protein 1 [Bacteroidota bacterium]|jgi:ribosomal protein S18 acetylase RimI-like enzyme